MIGNQQTGLGTGTRIEWPLVVLAAIALGACSGGKPKPVTCPDFATDDPDAGPTAPVAWPEDTPELYRASEFERIASEAVAEVHPPVELLEVDCSEAPCLAVIRTGTGVGACQDLTRTRAWRPYSGDLGHMGSWATPCDDGSTDRICILGTSSPGWSCAVQAQVFERNPERIEQLNGRWICRDHTETD